MSNQFICKASSFIGHDDIKLVVCEYMLVGAVKGQNLTWRTVLLLLCISRDMSAVENNIIIVNSCYLESQGTL